MAQTKNMYARKLDHWIRCAEHLDVHPDFPVDDWKSEVANDETRFGYKDWLRGRSLMIRDGDVPIPGTETEDG